MKNNLMATIVVAIIVGGLGFFGGMQYQKTNTKPAGPGGQFQQLGNGQNRPAGLTGRNGTATRGGMTPVSGEILSIDDTSITIKSQDGSSKIVVYADSTTINKTSEGSSSDLQVGEEVMVIGTEDTNGTVTAQTISVGGAGSFFRGVPGAQPTTEEGN